MNDTKHTPGPWIALNNKGNSGKILTKWHIASGAISIAVITEKGNDTIANAKLIAAAPEMLDFIMNVARCYISSHSNKEDWNKMQAIIKKATE